MALDLSTLTDYAWSDIAIAAKTAMVNAALGGNTLTIDGKTIGRISIDEAKSLYALAQEQIALEDAGANGDGIVLVRFGEAQ
jgi:hypothetical protein